ncbi:hypothetical protein QPJ90_03980 [Curtobacterium sp. 458]|nr:hypothetical protein [Curtobacterium sp. 458]WJY00863.1 hypothetical protein QPJ90_03980 [Curtobacterium sp. 458]
MRDLLSDCNFPYRPLLVGVKQAFPCVQEPDEPQEVHGRRRGVFSKHLLEAAWSNPGCGSDVVQRYRKVTRAVHEAPCAINLFA